jgi:hypothetical protein
MFSENLASVVLVCGVLAAILIVALKRSNSFKADAIASTAADEISKQLDALIRKEVRYDPVRASSYPMLDLSYYDETQKFLETKSFRLLGDFIDADFAQKNPGFPLFMRIMVSSRGVVSAAIFHFLREDLGVSFHLLDLITEMKDGVFLLTSKSAHASTLGQPPGIKAVFTPEMNASELLRLHSSRVKEYAEESKSTPVAITDIESVMRSDMRQQQIKNKFYESSTDEMIRQQLANLGKSIDQRLLKEVTDKVIGLRNCRV